MLHLRRVEHNIVGSRIVFPKSVVRARDWFRVKYVTIDDSDPTCLIVRPFLDENLKRISTKRDKG